MRDCRRLFQCGSTLEWLQQRQPVALFAQSFVARSPSNRSLNSVAREQEAEERTKKGQQVADFSLFLSSARFVSFRCVTTAIATTTTTKQALRFKAINVDTLLSTLNGNCVATTRIDAAATSSRLHSGSARLGQLSRASRLSPNNRTHRDFIVNADTGQR